MVKATGTVKKIDRLGRVELPTEVRQALDMQKADGLEILVDEKHGQVILRKTKKACFRCQSTKHLQEIKAGYYLCGACVSVINGKRNRSLFFFLFVGVLAFCCTYLCFEVSYSAYWERVLVGDSAYRSIIDSSWLPAVVGCMLIPLDIFISIKCFASWNKN